MPKTRPPYPAQFRQQMIELVNAGRTPAELSRGFNVTAQTIANWVAQAARNAGKPPSGKEGLTTDERAELARLRRQLKQVQAERDMLAKATAWFAGRSDATIKSLDLGFGNCCRQMGVTPSMGTVGDAYDNAMAESFFATLECELIPRKTFETRSQARVALFTWIEGWYNPRRRHSGLGYQSPMNFERIQLAQQAVNQTTESEHELLAQQA